MFRNLMDEVRQACGSLGRSPAFTLPVVLVLGLGLGANVALHGILQAVLLRPLPVRDRSGLVLVKAIRKGEKGRDGLSFPQFEDLAAAPGPFAAMTPGVKGDSEIRLKPGQPTLKVNLRMVGPGWSGLLGLRMDQGRPFSAQEDADGALVAVISHRLWKTALGADPQIVGRVLVMGRGGKPVTVVGVAPAGFEGLELGREELWMPLHAIEKVADGAMPPGLYSQREGFTLFEPVARLKVGATLAQAQAALDAASALQARLHPEANSGIRYVAGDLNECERRLLDQVLPQRTLLLGAAALALALATVAATGLFAARAAQRERELATRSALGAGTADLVRPMLLEALLLGLLAAPVALGTGLAMARRFMLDPGQAPAEGLLLPTLDPRMLAFGVSLSLLALFAAALVPVLRIRRLDPARILAAQGGGRVARGAGGAFVALQVALSLVLVAASSVAMGAFRKAARMGFPVQDRALLVVDGQGDKGLSQRLLARLKAQPEILEAARSIVAPLDRGGLATFSLKGGDWGERLFLPASLAGAGWFAALGVPLVEGRDFRAGDGTDKVILNETLARRFFPEGRATGRILQGDGSSDPFEVIGVVADHRMRLDPDFHLPMIWLSDAYFDRVPTSRSCLLVWSRAGGRQALGRLKAALGSESPGLKPERALTLQDHVAASLHQENQNLRLLGFLGLGSLALACFGLWSALQLQVALRWHEMGIRAALGATAGRLALRILGLGTRLLGLGLAGGAILVWALMRVVGSRLPGLPAVGLADLGFALGALLAAGLLACLIPALRVARVNPGKALRAP